MSRVAWLKQASLGAASGLFALGTSLLLPSGGCGADIDEVIGREGECKLAVDDDNACTVDSCDEGVVMHTVLPDGTPCAVANYEGICSNGQCAIDCEPGELLPVELQAQGDCQDRVCVSAGTTTNQPNYLDLPIPPAGSICKVGKCTMGAPSVETANSGSACTLAGGMEGVCDTAGNCAACVIGTGSGCPSGEICFDANGSPMCTSCANGMKDGDETDVDCGGECATCLPGGPCKKCGLGQTCVDDPSNCDGLSCVDHVCCENACGADCKTCEPGTGKCIDVATGLTDVCDAPKVCTAGAGCKARAGATCSANNDCMSNDCSGGMLVCSKSDVGEPCIDNTDCVSGKICNANKVCQ